MIKFKITHNKIPEGSMEITTPLTEYEANIQFTEIFVRDCYKQALRKKDMVIIDIGANMGLTALYFKDHAKVIYAIEPSSQSYQALVENTKAYPNIKTFNLAIAHENGPVKLHTNDSGGVPDSVFGNGGIEEIVQGVTLEKFMTDNNIDHVDVLKVDCEGAEYLIFPSFEFKRMAPKIDFIIGEAHIIGDAQPAFLPLMLEDSGFKLKWDKFKNYFKTLTYTDATSGEKKEYKAYFNTNFTAEK